MRCEYLPNDFEARLNGGVAFYDGKPVLINAAGGTIAICTFPEGQQIKRIEPDDPSLDISSPQLGYINTQRNCYYIYRKPARRYKQTLTHQAIDYYDPVNTDSVKNTPISLNDQFYSTNFKKMLENEYPPLDGVLKALNSETSKIKSRAISRDVALAIDSFGIVRVYYKMEEVGYINPGSTTVQVPGGTLAWVISKYLREYAWEVV